MIYLTVIILTLMFSSHVKCDTRIVGGTVIDVERAPYQVSIRILSSSLTNFGDGFFCGGVLISNTTVVTAAHCVVTSDNKMRNPKDLQIVAGATFLTNRTGAFLTTVSSIKVHEKYNANAHSYDIAVMKLSSAVPFGVNVRNMGVLPLPNTTYVPGTMCYVTGWGTTASGGSISAQLKGASVQVHSVADCNRVGILDGDVIAGMLCAGPLAGGQDACQGDSGGPLECSGVLAGIVSHGYGCALETKPGIYTDVFYFADWVRANDSANVIFSKMLLFLSLTVLLSHINN